MDDKSKNKKLSKLVKVGVAGAVVGLSLTVAKPSFAVTAVGPIDQLKLETAKVEGVYNLLVPPAVGSMIFAVGAVLVKRIAFA